MNIAWSTIYGKAYCKDRLFDNSACKIGENLLMPNIKLKERLEAKGHSLHTVDVYRFEEIDKIVFQEIPLDSILTIRSPLKMLKYVLKRKWKNDFLLKALLHMQKADRYLVIMEPEVVAPESYHQKYHKYFHKIFTWNDALVDSRKYIKLCVPQYLAEAREPVPFLDKKLAVMICGNKTSGHPDELYSKRYEAIQYFENKPNAFDLYGFGWENMGLRNYKGFVEKKLDTLSQYRFAVCYENMTNVQGYITEKIFDCFFAGCVPIYWGADNITDYIPENCFIDRKCFKDMDEVLDYISNMSEEAYSSYLAHAQEYLQSSSFKDSFSVEAYAAKVIDELME